MIWKQHFDNIYLLNLSKRVDRLVASLRILNDYEIEVERFEAIEDENGAAGLVKTMKKLFSECIAKGYSRILVFEDDIDMIENKEVFHDVMDKSCLELSNIDWDIFYLGTNHPAQFTKKYSETLLPISQGYSTHAAAYSLRAMEFVVKHEIDEPVDVWLVRNLQPHRRCYCTFPMLCSQRVDYSDIAKNSKSWKFCLEDRFNQMTRLLKNEDSWSSLTEIKLRQELDENIKKQLYQSLWHDNRGNT